MIYTEQPLQLEGEDLILNNLRALYWPRANALIVSDMHIGKTAHFRRYGIPIPANVQDNDLERLSFLMRLYNIEQLIVVGDLFHAEHNSDVTLFKEWRKAHSKIEVILIKGNHDRFNNDRFRELDIGVHDDVLEMFPFSFVHDPNSQESKTFSICGHLHPGYTVKTKNMPAVKLPCFQVTEHHLILPAFSLFTGLAVSKSKKGASYYAFTETTFYKFI